MSIRTIFALIGFAVVCLFVGVLFGVPAFYIGRWTSPAHPGIIHRIIHRHDAPATVTPEIVDEDDGQPKKPGVVKRAVGAIKKDAHAAKENLLKIPHPHLHHKKSTTQPTSTTSPSDDDEKDTTSEPTTREAVHQEK